MVISLVSSCYVKHNHVVGLEINASIHFTHAPRAIITGMEPKSSPLESAPGGAPQLPEFQPPNPERTVEVPNDSPEQGERSPAERESAPPVQPPTSGPIPITLPQPMAPPVQDEPAVQANDDSPQAAADDDLIEKEWVDKAKQIIAETRDDPHKREREVGRLQADYLKKRYGKELGASQ